MDVNKLERLRGIGYVIKETCWSCQHARFNRCCEFGICINVTYEHQKHTTSERSLSIHRAGWCDNYVRNNEVITTLHGFSGLVE